MQLLDDDMDDLFRNAAKDYPLRLPADDWDVIAGKMANASFAKTVEPDKKAVKSYRQRFLLAALLLLLSGIIIFIFKTDDRKSSGSSAVHQQTESSETLLTNNNRAEEVRGHNDQMSSSNLEQEPLLKKEIVLPDEVKETEYPGPAGTTKSGYEILQVAVTNAAIGSNKMIHDDEDNQNDTSMTNRTEKADQEKSSNPINNQNDRNTGKHTRFYAGILTGPQFNQVKNQGFSKPGIYTGILAGFQFSKKWSIEAGLFIAEKKYSSKGEYFSMTKISSSMPAGMQLENITGKSTVFEIPLKLKYDFRETKKSTLFATAGVSSYILTNERNNYRALINSNRENLSGNYATTNKYFGSTIQISSGYEYKAGKITWRLEPYIQVPLKGIGVGSLPVMSTGMNIGITIPVTR